MFKLSQACAQPAQVAAITEDAMRHISRYVASFLLLILFVLLLGCGQAAQGTRLHYAAILPRLRWIISSIRLLAHRQSQGLK